MRPVQCLLLAHSSPGYSGVKSWRLCGRRRYSFHAKKYVKLITAGNHSILVLSKSLPVNRGTFLHAMCCCYFYYLQLYNEQFKIIVWYVILFSKPPSTNDSDSAWQPYPTSPHYCTILTIFIILIEITQNNSYTIINQI